MSGEPVPINAAATSASSSSLWDRVTTWASENKVVTYAIAGTVIVVAGGSIYYFSDSSKSKRAAATEKKKSKKERRKEKKQAEDSKTGISLKDEEAGQSDSSHDTQDLH
jgi:import receptor subunit TOM70